MDEESLRLLISVVGAALTGLGGVVLGHQLSRGAARRDAEARQRDAINRREIERIERTAAFYVRLLDWHVHVLNAGIPHKRPAGRPRFAEAPDVNLALLGVPQLMQDVDAFLQTTENRRRSGQGLDRHTTNIHLELVDHIIDSSNRQITALLGGEEPRRLPPEEVSRRLRAERVEEIKWEGPTRG